MDQESHPVDRHVGARIRALRLERGVSQNALADKLGLSFQQIQKYERGINRISASKLHEASEVLEVPIGAFFEGFAGHGTGARAPVVNALDEVTQLMRSMPSAKQEEVRLVVRVLAR